MVFRRENLPSQVKQKSASLSGLASVQRRRFILITLAERTVGISQITRLLPKVAALGNCAYRIS